jgi:hypothetical protein
LRSYQVYLAEGTQAGAGQRGQPRRRTALLLRQDPEAA